MDLRLLPVSRALVALLAPLAGCALLADDPPPDAPPDDPLAGYRAAAAALAAGQRTVVPDGAYTLLPAADRLFWIDHQGVPSLHAVVDTTGARLDYAFGLGDEDPPALAVSAALVVRARRVGDVVVYQAWRADAPATLIGELTVPAPLDEQRTWPMAVDGGAVWLARDEGAGPVLRRWRPGVTAVDEPVLALADVDPPLAQVDALGVAAAEAVVIEHGRAWRVELATGAATWVRAATEAVGEVSIDPTGVLIETADVLLWLPPGATAPVDVDARIASAPPVVPFYATGHHRAGAAALRKGQVAYLGQVGVFRHDLMTGAVVPLALVPAEPAYRVDYRQPTWLDTGALHVLALTSTSGAVGATGPIVRIPAAP